MGHSSRASRKKAAAGHYSPLSQEEENPSHDDGTYRTEPSDDLHDEIRAILTPVRIRILPRWYVLYISYYALDILYITLLMAQFLLPLFSALSVFVPEWNTLYAGYISAINTVSTLTLASLIGNGQPKKLRGRLRQLDEWKEKHEDLCDHGFLPSEGIYTPLEEGKRRRRAARLLQEGRLLLDGGRVMTPFVKSSRTTTAKSSTAPPSDVALIAAPSVTPVVPVAAVDTGPPALEDSPFVAAIAAAVTASNPELATATPPPPPSPPPIEQEPEPVPQPQLQTAADTIGGSALPLATTIPSSKVDQSAEIAPEGLKTLSSQKKGVPKTKEISSQKLGKSSEKLKHDVHTGEKMEKMMEKERTKEEEQDSSDQDVDVDDQDSEDDHSDHPNEQEIGASSSKSSQIHSHPATLGSPLLAKVGGSIAAVTKRGPPAEGEN